MVNVWNSHNEITPIRRQQATYSLSLYAAYTEIYPDVAKLVASAARSSLKTE